MFAPERQNLVNELKVLRDNPALQGHFEQWCDFAHVIALDCEVKPNIERFWESKGELLVQLHVFIHEGSSQQYSDAVLWQGL